MTASAGAHRDSALQRWVRLPAVWAPSTWRAACASAVGVAGATLLLAQTAVNVSNFGFHLLATRMLGPAGYGALGSLLAVLTAMSVPAGAFETIVSARVAAEVEKGGRPDGRAAWRRSLLVGVAGMAAMLALTPLAQSFLHLGSVWPWLWLSAYCIPLALTVVPWGLVCGRRRFASAGGAALAAAITRIGAAAVFIHLGWGAAGAVAASLVGDGLRVALLVRPAGLARPVTAAVRLRIELRQAVRGTVAFTGLWLLLGVDTLLARHFFVPIVAGEYAAAATAARAAFFVAQAVCVLAVPRFATADLARARAALRVTVAAAAGSGVVCAAGLGVVGPRLAGPVFGAGFHLDGVTLLLLGVGATELAVLWVAVQYQLARGTRGGAAGWVGIVLAAAGAALWHQDGTRLALVMVLSLAATVVIAARSLRGADPAGTRPAMRGAAGADLTAGGLVAESADPVDLSVVVPFYNPGESLRPNVVNLLAALQASGATFEVITVEDGCTDGSGGSIADLDPGTLRRLRLPRNHGKGAALRTGLAVARGRYIGFIDADGDLDPALWQPFLTLVRMYRPDVVIGSKVHPLSEIDPDISWTRRACSAGYRALVRLLFPRLPVRDTQVGIKVFRRELLVDVLPRTVQRRFAFDLELLVAARRMGYRRILPAPVTLRARTRSTVTARLVARTGWDTLTLAWRTYARAAYDPAPRADPQPSRPPARTTPQAATAPAMVRTQPEEGLACVS